MNMEWIDIKKELPKNGETVLGYTKAGKLLFTTMRVWGLAHSNVLYRTRPPHPIKWFTQFLEKENIWYLCKLHYEDGILDEIFFDTEKELLQYIKKEKISIKSTNDFYPYINSKEYFKLLKD